MKWRLLGVVAFLAIILAACNGMNTDSKNNDKTNDNVEPTRYNTNQNSGANDWDRNRNDNRLQDGNIERTGNKGDRQEDYTVAKEAADKITRDIPEIDRAYVLTTNKTAYVAAGLNADNNRNEGNRSGEKMGTRDSDHAGTRNKDNADPGDNLTDDVKSRIGDIVKSVDNNIDNVYVSTNPDFFDLTNNYVDDMEEGRPIRGFFDQFCNMVERLFPQNRP